MDVITLDSDDESSSGAAPTGTGNGAGNAGADIIVTGEQAAATSAQFHDSIAEDDLAAPAPAPTLSVTPAAVLAPPPVRRLPLPPALRHQGQLMSPANRMMRAGGPPGMGAARGGLVRKAGSGSLGTKRPGQFPPFALFSQEERPKLQEAQPGLSFSDLGRLLGEMWHGLTEEQKEEYRVRARQIQDKKVREWEHNQRLLRQRQQQQQQHPGMNRGRPQMTGFQGQGQQQPQRPVGGALAALKRKTHGYAVFTAEKRKYYTSLGMDAQQVMATIAAEWRSAPMKVKQGYEARARRINMIQEQKHMRMAGGQQGAGSQRPMGTPAHIHQQQQMAARQAGSGSSTIRIANVSSLAPPATQKASLNLPSSISISRIEPDISIVSERISPNKTAAPVNKPRQLPASTQLTRQLTPQQQLLQQQRARQLMRQRQLQQQMPQLNGNPNRLVGPGQVTLQQQQRRLTPQAQYAQMQRQRMMASSLNAGIKRPLMQRPTMGAQPAFNPANSQQQHLSMPPKRPRLNNTVNPPSNVVLLPPAESLGLCLPVNHNNVPLRDKFCRVCAGLCSKLGQIFPLQKMPAYVEKAKECLQMEIDLDRDAEEGLPSVICRRCCQMLSAFTDYRRRVNEGGAKLGRILAMRKEKAKEQEQKQKEQQEQQQKQQEEMQTAIPAESEVSSILPDLDMDIDGQIESGGDTPRILTSTSLAKPVSIKQEKHAGIPTITFEPLGPDDNEVEQAVKDKEEEEADPKEASPSTNHKSENSSEQQQEGNKDATNSENKKNDDSAKNAENDLVAKGDPLSGEEDNSNLSKPDQDDDNQAKINDDDENSLTFVQIGECVSVANDEDEDEDVGDGVEEILDDGNDDDEKVEEEEEASGQQQDSPEWRYDGPAQVDAATNEIAKEDVGDASETASPDLGQESSPTEDPEVPEQNGDSNNSELERRLSEKEQEQSDAVDGDGDSVQEDTETVEDLSQPELQATEDYLQATEEELQASKDQLQATENDLQPTENDLQASEDQLLANDEELQASKDQLQAAEDDLEADEDQLLASEGEEETTDQAEQVTDAKGDNLTEDDPADPDTPGGDNNDLDKWDSCPEAKDGPESDPVPA